ncbi:hypothetical protein BVC71_03920 [Marivivens niveibacter]|uniref:Cytochrome C biogenesis protein transmembrane domain-containing protein n=1 Tax=Marivivens niveibacter TaxID=1930667 RepID=A0A251X2K2_9RHOB|nr:cytochrome c biogenesis CcdA family protein [Marivivens niveibacter]OUD10645.1 hypothetical protein BVC71_03920 [Marivivens niveibacter]
MLQIVLGYVAGLLTLLNPCVLPLLPIIGASAMQDSRRAPVYLAAGLALSTALVGFILAVAGRRLGINETQIANVGAIFLIVFGALILIPARYSPFKMLSGVAGNANELAMRLSGSPTANFAAGGALGITWSPCIGPTMGAAVALASTGDAYLVPAAIMLAYGLGIGSVFLALSYGGQEVIRRRKTTLQRNATTALRVFGIISILVGLMILTQAHKYAEIWLIEIMPDWLLSLSVKL